VNPRIQPSEGFYSPVELLARFFQLRGKRGKFNTAEMEERQAALFGYAYAAGKGINSLKVRPGEGPQHDFDAEFLWKQGAVDYRLPVSLKRLPPERVNARETLDNIIAKAAIKSTGGDLLLAVHLDRAGRLEDLTIPKKFQIKELCLWGWSKPKHAEIFVNSYVMGAKTSHQWFIPFPPPGFQSTM
jgi:hypothetical protein